MAGQVAGAERFAGVDVAGCGIYARGILENLAGKVLIDQAAKLNVVIREDASYGEQAD